MLYRNVKVGPVQEDLYDIYGRKISNFSMVIGWKRWSLWAIQEVSMVYYDKILYENLRGEYIRNIDRFLLIESPGEQELNIKEKILQKVDERLAIKPISARLQTPGTVIYTQSYPGWSIYYYGSSHLVYLGRAKAYDYTEYGNEYRYADPHIYMDLRDFLAMYDIIPPNVYNQTTSELLTALKDEITNNPDRIFDLNVIFDKNYQAPERISRIRKIIPYANKKKAYSIIEQAPLNVSFSKDVFVDFEIGQHSVYFRS